MDRPSVHPQGRIGKIRGQRLEVRGQGSSWLQRRPEKDMSNKILSHRDLRVWQKSVDLVDLLYEMTDSFPKHELYGMPSQLRRAGVSVPSNSAEGNGRGTTQDYIRFLFPSYGSLMEVDTHVHLAQHRNYITLGDEDRVIERLSEIVRMLNGLINSLERRKVARDSARKGQ